MRYQKELKKLLNENIIDIILFGSTVKDGTPNDLDICLITKDKHIDFSEIKKIIHKLFKGKEDIEIIDINSVYSTLWLTLIKEGYSIKKQEYLFNIYKIKPMVLYKYDLKKLNNVQKVQFDRGIKNVIKDKGNILTRSVVLIPIETKNLMIEFLKNWNIYYESQEYELLPLLRKEEI